VSCYQQSITLTLMSNPQIFPGLSSQVTKKEDVDLSILSDFLASQISVGEILTLILAHLMWLLDVQILLLEFEATLQNRWCCCLEEKCRWWFCGVFEVMISMLLIRQQIR